MSENLNEQSFVILLGIVIFVFLVCMWWRGHVCMLAGVVSKYLKLIDLLCSDDNYIIWGGRNIKSSTA